MFLLFTQISNGILFCITMTYIFLTVVGTLLLFAFLFGMLLAAFMYIAYVLVASFFLWMIIDAAKSDKYVWLLFMVALPVVGALVYFFVEKKHEYRKVNPETGVHSASHPHQHKAHE